jgi:hypothetical protein
MENCCETLEPYSLLAMYEFYNRVNALSIQCLIKNIIDSFEINISSVPR